MAKSIIDKKFVCGLVSGALGYRLYKKFNKKMKPIAVKAVQNAILISDETKKFVSDVKEEALYKRNTKAEYETKDNNGEKYCNKHILLDRNKKCYCLKDETDLVIDKLKKIDEKITELKKDS